MLKARPCPQQHKQVSSSCIIQPSARSLITIAPATPWSPSLTTPTLLPSLRARGAGGGRQRQSLSPPSGREAGGQRDLPSGAIASTQAINNNQCRLPYSSLPPSCAPSSQSNPPSQPLAFLLESSEGFRFAGACSAFCRLRYLFIHLLAFDALNNRRH